MNRQRIIERLDPRASSALAPGGDHDLNPDFVPAGGHLSAGRPAAVLVALQDTVSGLSVILTKRSGALPVHAGQVAFPGGKVDETDADSVSAALREAHEEIGLPPTQVSVIGRLAAYRTGTGFDITPVVGFVDGPFEPVPEPGEVDLVFDVPLAHIIDPANHQRQSAIWKGKRRHYWQIPYGDHMIWGATAGMLVNLSQRLAPMEVEQWR